MWRKHRLLLGVLVMSASLWGVDRADALGGPGYGTPGAGSSSHSTQGYLGIDIRDVSEDQMVPLKLKETRGAEIIDVDHDGPACKAGLQLHDVILQMNGQVVEGQEQLRRMLRETPSGRAVSFVISRDGQQQTISTQMANRETVEREAWEQRYRVPAPEQGYGAHAGNAFFKSAPPNLTSPEPKGRRDFLGTTMILSSSFTGAKLEVIGPQLAEFFGAEGAGLLVRSVDANSPAEMAGLKAGDVVVKVNQIAVASGNDWSKTIHDNKGKPVSVVVLRDKHEQKLTLVPDTKKRSSVRTGSDLENYLDQTGRMVAEL
ncbi:MAG: PDZ domain-containing protein [Edaphobacter sp.]